MIINHFSSISIQFFGIAKKDGRSRKCEMNGITKVTGAEGRSMVSHVLRYFRILMKNLEIEVAQMRNDRM